MARISPFEFFQQVRSEALKVTWPTRRETVITTIMVFIMGTFATVFFFLTDVVLSKGVSFVLGVGN
jgi:preprotein translocase subunit SecE